MDGSNGWLNNLLEVCIGNGTVSWQYSSLVQGQLKGLNTTKKDFRLVSIGVLFLNSYNIEWHTNKTWYYAVDVKEKNIYNIYIYSQ